MTPRTYLDHNATTPLRPEAREAMAAAFEVYGNPSSIHAEGRQARGLIDGARQAVSNLTGAAVDDIVFTSGGTEALNIALTPRMSLDGRGCDHLLMGGGEHPAVRAGHRFGDAAETVPLLSDGTLDLAALRASLARLGGKRVMLALQAANNETGVVQPVAEAAALIHAHGGIVICDAVQAAGKMSCDIKSLGADVIAISGHKFGGPKGVGALCFGPGRHHLSGGVVRGGDQERGLRAGTENLLGIVGLGAACGPAEGDRLGSEHRLGAWRSALEAAVIAVVPDAIIFGHDARRLPNTVCFAAPGFDARVLLMGLDLNGIAVSAGSACAAGKVKPSQVLASMGVTPDLSAAALRVSLGWTTQAVDIERFEQAFAATSAMARPRAAA